MLSFIKKLLLSFKEYFVLAILLLISLTFLANNNSPKVKGIRNFAFGNFAFINSIVESIIDPFIKDEDVEELKRRNAELMLEINTIRELGVENENLRGMLDYKNKSQYPLLPSSVVSKLVSKAQGNFILNKGYNDSVRVGMPVLNELGLVGLITDAADNFSVVRTLNNTGLRITVINQRSRVEGVLAWNGKKLVIKNVPTTHDVKVGDRIITSDFSTVFPPNVPIGLVSGKESDVLGLLNDVEVEPFVDSQKVKNVFILLVVPSKQIKDLELNLMGKK